MGIILLHETWQNEIKKQRWKAPAFKLYKIHEIICSPIGAGGTALAVRFRKSDIAQQIIPLEANNDVDLIISFDVGIIGVFPLHGYKTKIIEMANMGEANVHCHLTIVAEVVDGTKTELIWEWLKNWKRHG